MISLDTNVLIRILVDDPDNEKQNNLARDAAQKYDSFFISKVVQVELVWVLMRAYKIKKSTILSVLNELLSNQVFILENQSTYEKAMKLFKKHPIDFSDCLIYTAGQEEKVKKTLTFDKKFSKLPHVSLP